MSFLTGTGAELIYSLNASAAGTAKNTFTSEAVINDLAGCGPQPFLPQGFFIGGSRKVLKVVARGIVGATTTGPTWQIGLRAGAQASVAGPLLAQSISTAGAVMTGLASTTIGWEMEADIVVGDSAGYTLGTGSTTVRGSGVLRCPRASASVNTEVWANAAQPGQITNFDPSIGNYLNVTAVCGTSNASNSIQLLQLLVFGLN